ncbi:MAG: hypothetical protein KFH98_01910, partial [Gemmatimonadetes bacterium]|nr:hypothetical protein [Gemmatimonadota bacterium]
MARIAALLLTLLRPDGRYRVTAFPGVLSVSVAATGFRTVHREVSRAGTLDVVLEPLPYRLAAVSVTGRT